MKPDTVTAMHHLIRQVRDTLPFNLPDAYVCSDDCNGCSLKLLEFLDMELMEWENRLAAGYKPNFGDLNKMARMSKKIYRVMEQNGLVKQMTADSDKN
ncbi:MAG: hypothetical protein EP315_01940 [Gammaproteobacteria bacterium]|nr:MAG: hypothetical protein EP315_01940 [Gammaproteobacteria bacterium]